MLEFHIMNITGNLDKINVNQMLCIETKLASYFFIYCMKNPVICGLLPHMPYQVV